MSYCTGAFGVSTAMAPNGERAPLSSSRKIDPVTRRYVPADDGGFEAMDDVTQRVYLYLLFNVDLPDRVDPRAQRTLEQRIRTALTPMTSGPEPDVKLLEVSITDDSRETSFVAVRFMNLRTNTQTTVQR